MSRPPGRQPQLPFALDFAPRVESNDAAGAALARRYQPVGAAHRGRSHGMPQRIDATLGEIRRRRRRILAELCLVVTAAVGLAFVDAPPLASAPALLLAAFAMALLLFLAGSGRFFLSFLAVLEEACPRCRGLFFVSWQRLLYSFTYLSPSCAHCGLSWRREARAPHDSRPC
jgi:hypothetical protein